MSAHRAGKARDGQAPKERTLNSIHTYTFLGSFSKARRKEIQAGRKEIKTAAEGNQNNLKNTLFNIIKMLPRHRTRIRLLSVA
jgi:hypothetical protein